MNLNERISALSKLGQIIREELDTTFSPVISKAIAENGWFTEASIKKSLLAIAHSFLDEQLLLDWTSKYRIEDGKGQKVGLILAGNIPLVGIHDVISVFVSGHISLIKYSSRDKALLSYLISRLGEINPGIREYFIEKDRLNDMDAVIATGGETAATHFHYYFSKYPHIIRKNRSSVAVITPTDGPDELKLLGADIFDYFGLGCRSVSKLYIPREFVLDRMFEAIVDYGYVIDHNKYKNNYDYSYSIYLLGKHKFFTNNFLIIMEEERLSSRIACINFERYDNLNEVSHQLNTLSEDIQCIVSGKSIPGLKTVPFGTSQSPGLDDYADQMDTMVFLTNLYEH